MSEFGSLSPDFRKSLDALAESLEDKQSKRVEASDASKMQKLAQDFVDGPVMRWYESLSDADRAEVIRVFAEVREFEPEEILSLMKSEGKLTPLGFMDGFFAQSDDNFEEEVLEG